MNNCGSIVALHVYVEYLAIWPVVAKEPALKHEFLEKAVKVLVLSIPSVYPQTVVFNLYGRRRIREVLAVDELMVQGIDWTSVSPFCRHTRLWGSLEWCTLISFSRLDVFCT
jgi:hypothetical protein